MNRHYHHLGPEERAFIMLSINEGHTLTHVARSLGRSPSTISREVARNASSPVRYEAAQAGKQARKRLRAPRRESKLALDSKLWHMVEQMLRFRWSPQQISGKLRAFYPNQPEMQVSHETIYTAIYAMPKGELRREIMDCLRRAKSGRKPRSVGEDRRGQLPNMLTIHERPPEVESRLVPGHWEADLIKGAGNKSSVAVLVERNTRFLVLAYMPDASSASMLEALTKAVNRIEEPLRITLTYDRGKEMSRHVEFTERTGMQVYFADPHSPWQRGTCENSNGLIRQYLPKGTDLSIHSQADLDEIAFSLNTRPRAALQFKMPLEAYNEIINGIVESKSAIKH